MLGEYLGAGSAITKGLWHLNGSSADSSGNSANGTDTNITYSLANGKLGQGAGFNTTPSSYISMGNVCSFDYNQAFTISCWMNNGQTGSSNIVSKQQNGSPYGGYGIGTDASGYIQIFIYGSSGAFIKTSSSKATGAMTHVVFTYDGSNTLAGLKGYINNSAATFADIVNDTFTTTIVSTTPFQISGRGGAANLWKGNMDEVIVEAGEWSASKIKKYYTYSKGRFGII